MDKIADFFKELKDRFSNPFFSSYIIAWLIFNWKIPIALLFYQQSELQKDGYCSFIDMINVNLDKHRSFLYPLGLAFLYTFGFPFLKNLISISNAWFEKWGMNISLKTAGKGSISIEKYLKLRALYIARRQNLEEVLGQESIYLEENKELVKEAEKNSNTINRLDSQMLDIKNKSNNNFFDGSWSIKFDNNRYAETETRIQNGKFYALGHSKPDSFFLEIATIAYNREFNIFFLDILDRQNNSFLVKLKANKKGYHSNKSDSLIKSMIREEQDDFPL